MFRWEPSVRASSELIIAVRCDKNASAIFGTLRFVSGVIRLLSISPELRTGKDNAYKLNAFNKSERCYL